MIEAGASTGSEDAPGGKRRKVGYPAILPRADFGLGGSVESSSAMGMEGGKAAKARAPQADRRRTPEERRRYYEQNNKWERLCSKAYREQNRESVKEYQRKYRVANKDRIAKARKQVRP